MSRSIKTVIASQKVNMGGIILDQPLPSNGLDMVDPFLLIHHWDDKLDGGQKQQEAGVGPHPHRGFTPVTFIFKGGVHHRDSTGIESIIEAGGTQWMNSGSGIVHSERPTKELAESGGKFEIIQFWVNSPAASKFDPPSYQPLKYEDTPIVTSEDGHVTIGVVAGQFHGKTGPVSGSSPLATLRLEATAKGKMSLEIPKNYNALLYVLDGGMIIGDKNVGAKDMVVFNNDGDSIDLIVLEDTRAIILSGEPINEPVVSYGPFVMNSEQEIREAIRDYQNGKLGTLVEHFEG
jgi:quercetin 2,3-dioxygenase